MTKKLFVTILHEVISIKFLYQIAWVKKDKVQTLFSNLKLQI